MSVESPLSGAPGYEPVERIDYHGVVLPARFGDLAVEYRHTRSAAGLFDRSERGLLVVTGPDRKPWLHNLVTNAVKPLADNAGAYAFATNVKGRVQFDLNILSMPDALWLDIDIGSKAAIAAHLEHYHITEKIELADRSGDCGRVGCCGPLAERVAADLGVVDLGGMAQLASVWVDGESMGTTAEAAPADAGSALLGGRARLMRHDFAGLPGFELIVPRTAAAWWWRWLASREGVRPAGFLVLDALRIEAGIPWLGRDIDDRVVAPETGQIERAISYNKGCYLGQEVIERIRSYGAPARTLVRLQSGGHSLRLAPDAPDSSAALALKQGDAEVGRITSLVPHPAETYAVGLGYVKAALANRDGLMAGDPPQAVTVIS